MSSAIIPFWFDEESHTYSEAPTGRPIISVTQTLASVGIVSYDFVKQSILEYKSALGVAVHAATHYLDEGVLDWDTVDPVAVRYVTAWEKFTADFNFRPRLIEHRGAVRLNGVPVGYQLDREGIATIKGKDVPAIAEIKCTSGIEKSWKYQLGGYEGCLRAEGLTPQGDVPWWTRFGVQLKPDGTYAIAGPYDMPHHKNIFLAALAVAAEKLNEGIGDKL